MDKISSAQIINRIPELKYKYIGSFPSNAVPNLPKYSFAIVNSAPSHSVGEHWIMIARLHDNYFYADSLGRPYSSYSFLNSKYTRMVPRKLQRSDNLCGFHAIYAAFQLFKFFQKQINNIHDVHVLNFISNYMQ